MVFNQAISVPKTDREVAKILKKIREEGFGLKNAVYGHNSNFNRNTRRNMSLAVKILEKFSIIEHILNTTQILSKETHLDPWLARVLIHKLLRNKELTHECKPAQTIHSYKNEIQDAIETYQETDSLQPKIKVFKPRYVRVNTSKMSVDTVINLLRDEGMVFLSTKYETYAKYLEELNHLSSNHFMIDFHVKEMLVFHHTTQFIKHPLYINGILLLQDKASCLSPLLLDPPKGSVVLDMCAAPGMKTNYLANQVGKKGRVYAVEKNQQRYLTLSQLTRKQGMKNIYCMHRDALKINGDELADVEYILVDPSCSGTGMVDRIDVEKSAPDRIKFLSGFQKNILRHALTRFPNAKRVVYSTCSLQPEENEEVVSFVLGIVKNFQLVNLQEKLGSKWNNFGSDKYGDIGTSCLYAKSEQDLTNGFFVAVFERITKPKVQKRKYDEIEETETNEEETPTKEKKKKSKKNADDAIEETQSLDVLNNEVPEKKKKKKKDKAEKTEEMEEEPKKKKKKKDKNVETNEENVETKKKKKKGVVDDNFEEKGDIV